MLTEDPLEQLALANNHLGDAPTREHPREPGAYWVIPRKGLFGALDHLAAQWMMMRVFEYDGGLAVESFGSEDSIPIALTEFEWFYGPLVAPPLPVDETP